MSLFYITTDSNSADSCCRNKGDSSRKIWWLLCGTIRSAPLLVKFSLQNIIYCTAATDCPPVLLSRAARALFSLTSAQGRSSSTKNLCTCAPSTASSSFSSEPSSIALRIGSLHTAPPISNLVTSPRVERTNLAACSRTLRKDGLCAAFVWWTVWHPSSVTARKKISWMADVLVRYGLVGCNNSFPTTSGQSNAMDATDVAVCLDEVHYRSLDNIAWLYKTSNSGFRHLWGITCIK